MRTFLFLALRNPDLTARVIRAAGRTEATIILDLEDALWDVDDDSRTAELKEAGRVALVALARQHSRLFADRAIGVRLNRLASPDAERDIAAIAGIRDAVELDCIVVPKVEDAGELGSLLDRMGDGSIACRSLVPIVETRAAMDRLGTLLPALGRAGIGWLVFGTFDLALDSGSWPLPGPESPALWEEVEAFIGLVEAAGMSYVHAPFVETHDDGALERVLGRLREACRRDFGILTVALRQAAAASRFAELPAPGVSLHRTAAGAPEPVSEARRIVDLYRRHRVPEASFAIDPASGEFIPPHTYLAARRFLASRGVGIADLG